MDYSYEEIKTTFAFEYGIKKRFPYAKQYDVLMQAYLSERQLSSAQQVRYMLMALYPLFRASADNNVSFTTSEEIWGASMTDNELLSKRIKIINKRLGKAIGSSDEYLKLLGSLTMGDLASCQSAGDLAQLLFNTVVKGRVA